MMKKLMILAVCLGSLVAAQVQAGGWYGRGFAGYTHANDTDLISNVNLEFEPGFNVGGALGYNWGLMSQGIGLRYEAEFMYRDTNVDKILIGGSPIANRSKSGSASTVSGMANLLFDIMPGQMLSPYVGGGIGWADLSLDRVRSGTQTVVNDSEGVFAYQALVGLNYDFNPKWGMTAEYRYFATENAKFNVLPPGGFNGNSLYGSHNISLGVKYNF
jgi:opacity protein-like surface antigen